MSQYYGNRTEYTPVPKANNIFYMEKPVNNSYLSPHISTGPKKRVYSKSRGKNRHKVTSHVQGVSSLRGNTKTSRTYKTKFNYSSDKKNKIFKRNSRSNSKNNK
jgi:hypothetical protein